MKNLLNFKTIQRIVGIIALVAVIGFAMFACSSPSSGPPPKPTPKTVTYTGTADGTTYSLKITEKITKAAYDPKGGDGYELTLSGSSKKSTGTVSSYTSGTLTLQPSKSGDSFTASVSGDNLTSLTGEITFDDNSKVEAPGELKPEDPPLPDEPTGGFIGATLTLTGQVQEYDWNNDKYSNYTGSTSVSALGKTGTITNGQLSFSIGTPTIIDLDDFLKEFFFIPILSNTSISTSGVKGNFIGELDTGIEDFFIYRGFESIGATASTSTGTGTAYNTDEVWFLYVDRDVTISVQEEVFKYQGETLTFNTFNISLKEGWNAIYLKVRWITLYDSIFTYAHANPNTMRWLLYERDDEDD